MLRELSRSVILEDTITRLRDKNTGPFEFRRLLQKLGRMLTYEIKGLDGKEVEIDTPLSSTRGVLVPDNIVVISVLRAALPMADAVLNEFETARLGIISASRDKMDLDQGRSFTINSNYYNTPKLKEKIVIIVDPMLASASTMLFILDKIKKQEPAKIIVLTAISAEYGVKRIEDKFPEVDIYSAAIDKELNSDGYIVPGLGDAGDRIANTIH
jgi:uracil phosphoribosyltransferase